MTTRSTDGVADAAENALELIADDAGLAVIGDPKTVDLFLTSQGLVSKELRLPKVRTALGQGSAVAQATSEIAANSSRWVKLTEESARKVKDLGGFTPTKTPGVSHAMIGKPGASKAWIQIVDKPGAMLTNPALLTGAAGVMAQFAMQQAMDEITDYLAVIDEKVDDILRAQKDDVLSRMIGAALTIDEAMTLREHGGHVNDVTWSKIQDAPATIAQVQIFALRQLDALAEKLEKKSKVTDIAKAAKDVEGKAHEWLAVLARSVQLQDAFAILELERVLTTAASDLDNHRLGLQAARHKRLDVISRTTAALVDRIQAAAAIANGKVLMHPAKAADAVESSKNAATQVLEFDLLLGISNNRELVEARLWKHAVVDTRDRLLEAGTEGLAEGVETAARIRGEATDWGRTTKARLARRVESIRRDKDGSDS